MSALREARAEPVVGGAAAKTPPSTAEDLRRQARQLKHQLAAFGKAAKEFDRRLDVRVSEAEAEAMSTPAANLLGLLDCLLDDDLEPMLEKLVELIPLLNDRSVAGI